MIKTGKVSYFGSTRMVENIPVMNFSKIISENKQSIIDNYKLLLYVSEITRMHSEYDIYANNIEFEFYPNHIHIKKSTDIKFNKIIKLDLDNNEFLLGIHLFSIALPDIYKQFLEKGYINHD